MTTRLDPVPAPRRLVVVGSVIAEVVMDVGELPARGGGTRAGGSVARAGGGFDVLVAGRRAGLAAAWAGLLGTGPMAELVGQALRREGIDVLLPPRPGEQGFAVVLTEPGGVATRVTSPGVESHLGAADLATVRLTGEDVAYLSAQDLLDPGTATAIARWCSSPFGLGDALLVLDPGALVSDVADDVLDSVLARTDVLAVGPRELTLLSGSVGDPCGASGGLDPLRDEAVVASVPGRDRALGDLADLLAPDAIVLLRLDATSHVLRERDGTVYEFPGQAALPARLAQVGDLLHHLAQLRAGAEGVLPTPADARGPAPDLAEPDHVTPDRGGPDGGGRDGGRDGGGQGRGGQGDGPTMPVGEGVAGRYAPGRGGRHVDARPDQRTGRIDESARAAAMLAGRSTD